VSFIIRTQVSYHATAIYLEQIQSNSWLIITQDTHHITLTPRSWTTQHTLLFYPWAKVDPEAYIYKLWNIALAHRLTVIIDKPLFGLQIFGINNADSVTGENLIIAWHSLWWAMACEYTKNHPERIKALILMWAYCNSDISALTWLRTLSFAASQDGLISLEEMKTYTKYFPTGHIFSILTWATHAQYGNYGLQDGDGISTISDDTVLQQISDEIGLFLDTIQ